MNNRAELINDIRNLPMQVERLIAGLTAQQLTTHYLANEWSVAQNVHHLADSHMNSYIRCKLIATEDNPTLKPYDQDAWARFDDAQMADVSQSLAMLRALHARWVIFFEELRGEQWERRGFHPDNGAVTLNSQLQNYAAHGKGHLDQITRTLAAGAIHR
jgi:hypothetical protein